MIRTKLRRISTSGHVLSQHRKDGEASKLKGAPWKERNDLPKMADYKLSLKMASGPRVFREDYRYTTWGPLSGRAARPGTAPDGQEPAGSFMGQDGKDVTLDMSAWELGFESPDEMYPDSPVEFQPELWLVRRIQPKTNVALKNINGFWERFIYTKPKEHRIYQTSNRLPNGPRKILNKMGLYRMNDWSIQYNSKDVNNDLWQIKPYVIITPIRIPDGLPTETEIESFKLLSNGELIDTRKRIPEHIKSIPKEEKKECKGIAIDQTISENNVFGVDSRLKKSRLDSKLTHHEELWKFNEDFGQPRRVKSQPKTAWANNKYISG